MLAAGVTAEQIVVAVEAAIECDKARRAQHAEWKRKRRLTIMSMDKSKVHGKERSPRPPKRKLLPPDCSTSNLSPNGGFDSFWKVYPRKLAKKPALKAYLNALKRAKAEEIAAGAERYATAVRGKEPEFIKHASTWLNADCWTDEPETKSSTVTAGPWKHFTAAGADPKKPTEDERERDRRRWEESRKQVNGRSKESSSHEVGTSTETTQNYHRERLHETQVKKEAGSYVSDSRAACSHPSYNR